MDSFSNLITSQLINTPINLSLKIGKLILYAWIRGLSGHAPC